MGRTRPEYTFVYLNAAKLFSGLTLQIEENYSDRLEDTDFGFKAGDLHRIYVISSIFHTITYLEANVNEFFRSIRDGVDGMFKGQFEAHLDSRFFHSLNSLEKTDRGEFTRRPWLTKYQLLLGFAGKSSFNEGEEPYQSVRVLNSLRNHFVHFESEWIRDEEVPTIGRSLRNKKFERNPLFPPDADFFPDQILSHGCTEWGINSAIEFTEEFHNRIGLERV